MADPLTRFLGTATRVQELGERYYEESRNWEAFPRKVKQLRRESNIWVEALKSSDISDHDIIDSLSEATSLLEKQEGILLERVQSKGLIYACVTTCCSRSHVFLFPEESQKRIQEVEAFQVIPRLLKTHEEANAAVRQRMLNRPVSMVFCKDVRYVPLETTEREVYSASGNSSDPTVVLLYGGPGQGNPTLARKMALHYNKSSKLFKKVMFLECGKKVDTSVKQLELSQHLAGKITEDTEKSTSDSNMSHQLRGVLRHQKILIIFDDVWEENFLRE